MDMNGGEKTASVNGPVRSQPPWWRRRWFKIAVSIAVVCCVVFAIVAEYAIHHAEPILRKRVVETLSADFHSPVELDRLDISLVKGIEVEGSGLRIKNLAGANRPDIASNAPMLSVDHFGFRTRLRGLLRSPTRIVEVEIQGMELHIPPSGQRGQLLGSKVDKHHQPKISLLVDTIRCKNVKLFIETDNPNKDPLEFDVQGLVLHDVGSGQPFTYTAELINPKPIGEIQATGHFGPWDGEEPRKTPLDGSYNFKNADLSTTRGISGILSSTGKFGGVLEHIIIDGETDTPDFALDVSDHPMSLHTVFHAYVDGTNGDTYLDPVQTRLGQSDFTAKGKIVSVKGNGHDIQLDVDIPNARMQDMLQLGVKTDPPLMNGVLTMKAKLHIPPGSKPVSQKIDLTGAFHLREVHFNDAKFQDEVDGLSARAQGKPKEVADVSTDREAEVHSTMSAKFSLGNGLMSIDDLDYQIPGAQVLLNGVYSPDGNVFDFKGHVRTKAEASQMVTGWKSWLLKPVDPLLKKSGAGLELPISIDGTRSDVHFGLALHGSADESSKQIAEDLRENHRAKIEAAKAKREEKRAKKEAEKDSDRKNQKQE